MLCQSFFEDRLCSKGSRMQRNGRQVELRVKDLKQKAIKRDKSDSMKIQQTNENCEKEKANAKLGRNQSHKKLLPQFGTHQAKLKNILIPMKYKEKLNHIEALIQEAKYLSMRFGFFYITFANILYYPDHEIKLSLWIHPSLSTNKCIHPIKNLTMAQQEFKFYTCLKALLKRLFPTIEIGKGESYYSLISHVRKLKQQLFQRLENHSYPETSELIHSLKKQKAQEDNSFSVSTFQEESASQKTEEEEKYSPLKKVKSLLSLLQGRKCQIEEKNANRKIGLKKSFSTLFELSDEYQEERSLSEIKEKQTPKRRTHYPYINI